MAEVVNSNQDRNEQVKEENKIFDIKDNLLLPIMVIFMLDKSGSNIPVVNNLKKMTKDLIQLPRNIDISTKDMEGMLNAIDTVRPYMNSNNHVALDGLSAFLSTLLKINTVKEPGNDMTRNSSDDSGDRSKFSNQRQKALHMIGALEQYMDEPTRKNMENFKRALGTLDKFQETSKVLKEKRQSGGKIEINDMLQLIGPLMGSGGLQNAQKIDSMIRMIQIMSALEENEDGSNDDLEEEDEDFFEFVIDRYDDEEDQ